MSLKNPYEILGLQRGASIEEVKKVYKIIALKSHPDKITDIDDEFTQGYASTTYPAPPSPILATTKNNRFYLDGMPLRDGSPYPPRSVRHHIDSTATHEIGHALGFQHNFVDKCALMNWGGVRWFVSGTKTPTQDELTSLAILYPNP